MTQSGVPVASSVLRSLAPPRWVGAGLDDGRAKEDPWAGAHDSDPVARESGEFAYVSARIAGATRLDAGELEAQVGLAYAAIASRLAGLRVPHPIRFWNYIPDLHAPMGELSRYMVFNAGRYRAMSAWLGGTEQLERRVATATGVGHDGEDLYVYCLGGKEAGRPVENPRQVPAYRYSRKYGPVPPCFSRASAVRFEGREVLLVGGTASVRGEHSVADAGIREQLLETFVNLATLVRTGFAGPGKGEESHASPWLERFRFLRAYCVNPQHAGVIRSMIGARFPGLESLEILRARVCRPELLVEIEGLAEGGA